MEHDTATIILALLCIGLVFALPADQHYKRNPKVKYCGSQLSAQISMVCEGRYNTLIPRRATAMPFIDPHDAKSLMRRRRRGITDECCKKACSRDELRMFCAEP